MIRPATMLAGVTVVLVILIAPYLRPWLAQRSDIERQQAEVADLQRQVDQLTAERQRWNDPTFVRSQAREKLNFVMPGEMGYVVLNDGRKQPAADPARQAAADAGRITGRPWYDVLWQSVQLAGRSPGTSRDAGSGRTSPTGAPTGGAATTTSPGAGTTPSPAPSSIAPRPTATPAR